MVFPDVGGAKKLKFQKTFFRFYKKTEQLTVNNKNC